MYSNCSVTAQHGALKWRPIFYSANLPVFEKLYESVKNGQETSEVIRDCGGPNYRTYLTEKLGDLHNSEIWRAGATVRALRPKEKAKAKKDSKRVKGISGRGQN